MNLYIENVELEGFRQVERGLEPGDVILMAIRSVVPNHGGIYVGGNNFIHHFWGSLSVEEMYKGMWKNRTMAIYRHPDVKVEAGTGQVDLMTLLPERLRQKLEQGSSSRDALATVSPTL